MHQSPNGEGFVVKTRAPGLANYPHARKAGGMFYISGISSRNTDSNSWRGTRVIGTSRGVKDNADGTWELDIKEQTRAVIENIQSILKEAGLGLENLVDLTVFLVDMKDYNDFNSVYNEFFNQATGPSRTTVAVHQLPNPRLRIEIKSVALVPQ